MSAMIWVQSVCKSNEQLTLEDNELKELLVTKSHVLAHVQ